MSCYSLVEESAQAVSTGPDHGISLGLLRRNPVELEESVAKVDLDGSEGCLAYGWRRFDRFPELS
jgi:hypothetical protein